MIFGLMLATVLLNTHVKKERNQNCQKWDNCLQITTCPFSNITETAPFPPRRLSDISIAIHSNSIAGYVIMLTIGLLYRHKEWWPGHAFLLHVLGALWFGLGFLGHLLGSSEGPIRVTTLSKGELGVVFLCLYILWQTDSVIIQWALSISVR